MSQQATVRFLLFPSGQEVTKVFPIETTFLVVKNTLCNEWPTNFPAISTNDELRLIHSGKMIEEKQTVQEVFKITSQNNTSVTVHIAIKKNTIAPKPVPVAPSQTPTPVASECCNHSEEELHFHYCPINEEEVCMVASIFEKKKGTDGKMLFSEVEKFLKTYWTWLKRNNFKQVNSAFPAQQLAELKQKLVGDNDRLTKDEFREFFYLFDNSSSTEQKCPHGEKLRVQFATRILHNSINPETEFKADVFDSVFATVDRDADGILSCGELELLYYLYSANIIEP